MAEQPINYKYLQWLNHLDKTSMGELVSTITMIVDKSSHTTHERFNLLNLPNVSQLFEAVQTLYMQVDLPNILFRNVLTNYRR
jgi:hypothetical protein